MLITNCYLCQFVNTKSIIRGCLLKILKKYLYIFFLNFCESILAEFRSGFVA